MTRWLYEDGIGEERAALIDQGRIIEARIVHASGQHGLGAVVEGRLLARTAGGHRARVLLDDGSEAMLQPVPPGLTEGMTIRAEVVREAMAETTTADSAGRLKPARLRAINAATPLRAAPRLIEQISAEGLPVEICAAHGADRLGESGWHDVLAEAETGIVPFTGGSLIICPTPAMTVVDVDGDLAPRALALAAAAEVARVIVRHDMGGNIVIDFPTLADKADRNAVVAAFDDAMVRPCERTAINGFGLMQVVLKRGRPSLGELHAVNPLRWHLLARLRSAERDGGTGPLRLMVTQSESHLLSREPGLIEALQRRSGRAVAVEQMAA